MALTLKYRNGFIDAEAMPPLQSEVPRASSLPPKMSMVQVEEFLQEEEPFSLAHGMIRNGQETTFLFDALFGTSSTLPASSCRCI